MDTETGLFSAGKQAPELVSAAIATGEEKAHLYVGRDMETQLGDTLDRVLSVGGVIAAHNAAYDWAVIMNAIPRLQPLIWRAYAEDRIVCTMVREKLIDIQQGQFRMWSRESYQFDDADDLNENKSAYFKVNYQLASIVKRCFGHQMAKEDTWRLRYIELINTPLKDWPQEAVDYAISDVLWGWRVYMFQERFAKSQANYTLPTQYLETRAQLALHLCHVWGIRTDYQSIHKLDSNIIKEMSSLREALYIEGILRTKRVHDEKLLSFGGYDFSDFDIKTSANTKLVKERVISAYKGNPPKTKKGGVSTSRETIEDCDDPLLTKYINYKKLEKLRTTYIRRFYDGCDLPIHPGFNEIGAESSRTSGYNPNMQNQPRLPGLRECFVAREGKVFVACDYDSQELRTLAQSLLDLLGKAKLAERYQKDPDYDPHTEFASVTTLKVSYEEGLALKKAKDKKLKKARQRAKIANFGLPGGMGVKGLKKYARGYGERWSDQDCIQVIQDWHIQWPDMRGYFNHVLDVVGESTGTPTIPQSGFQRGDCGYTNTANTYFQSLAAHASKEAAFRVARKCYDSTMGSVMFGSRTVNYVHDEIVVEAPELVAHEVALELEATMVAAMSRWVPDVPNRASASLMRHWRKDADPVFVNGRMVPVEDV